MLQKLLAGREGHILCFKQQQRQWRTLFTELVLYPYVCACWIEAVVGDMGALLQANTL